jgi:hypothetical protein
VSDEFNRDALSDILANHEDSFTTDPGGYKEWLEALVAWEVDAGEHLDAAKLAFNITLLSSVGTALEDELKDFEIRAMTSSTLAYYDENGELQASAVDEYDVSTLNDDPREVAAAIAAVVRGAAKHGENVVMFRKLVRKEAVPVFKKGTGVVFCPYTTRFALARIA